MSEWINIDKLGAVGIEPDRVQTATAPQSFTDAVNVRPVGPNLQNAGGYESISLFPTPAPKDPIGELFVTQYAPEEVRTPNKGAHVTQFAVVEIRQSNQYP